MVNKVNAMSNGVKRFSFVILVLALAIVVVGCKKKVVEEEIIDPRIFGVPETGVVIDATDRNGGSATTTPGDIIYIKLTGEALSGKQWSVAAPTSGSQLMLFDHQVVDLLNEEAEEFTDEWWLKIEETGEFLIKFTYGQPGIQPEDSFELNIISIITR